MTRPSSDPAVAPPAGAPQAATGPAQSANGPVQSATGPAQSATGAAQSAAGPAQAGTGMRLLLLATMAVWGGNVSVVKLLLQHFDPMLLSALRMTVASVTLLAVLRWRGLPWPRLTPRLALGLVACALLMVTLNQFLFTLGVQRTVAANAVLVIALNPLVSALTAALFLGDRLTPARLAGVALGFGGVAAVVLHRPGVALGAGSLGDVLVLGSVITWVAGGVLVRRLARQLDSAVVSTVVFVIGTVPLVAYAALHPSVALPDPSRITVGLCVLLLLSGLLASALGALVWNRALVTLGVARTALYAYWVPMFGVAIAVLWLGEPLTVWHGVGLAAVLGGTWLGTRGA